MLKFTDNGHLNGRQYVRSALLHQKIPIILVRRHTLPVAGPKSEPVWVVPGRALAPHLSPIDKRALEDFSRLASPGRRESLNTAMEAFKAYVAGMHKLSPRKRSRLASVPWKLGPIPVFRVGTLDREHVYATPLPMARPTGQLSMFPDGVVLEVIRDHFGASMEDYFADLADLVRASFFGQGRATCLRTVRMAQEMLATTIEPKLQMLMSEAEHDGLYHRELRMYRAAAALIRLMLARLESCVTGHFDEKWHKRTADAFDEIHIDLGERVELEECLALLTGTTERDEMACLPLVVRASSRPWIEDLKVSCRFLSEVLGLLEGYPTDSLLVFVSHIMDLYSTEEFYRQLKDAVRKRWKGNIEIITGRGRQRHFWISIIAKIWLADVLILYLPNSLDSREGGTKSFKDKKDWVVEELYYAALIHKQIHIVQATGIERSKPQATAEIFRVLKDYDWNTIPEELKVASKAPAKPRDSIERFLRVRPYTALTPRYRGLSESDLERLNQSIFVPAARKRLEDLAWCMRLAVHSDHWIVVRAMAHLYRYSPENRKNGMTIKEIARCLRNNFRQGGNIVTASWLRDKISSQLVNVKVRIGKEAVRLVSVSPRKRGREKVYMFDMVRLIDAVANHYEVGVLPAVLERVFWRAIFDYSGGRS